MTTIVEAMTEATAALNAAVAQVLSVRNAMQTQLDAKVTQATTTINNFVNRAPSVTVYVDPNLGVDAVGRGGLDTPYKSTDYALTVRDQSVFTSVYLLGDDTLTKPQNFYSSTAFLGVVKSPGANGALISPAQRKLSFLSEAIGSPFAGTGRIIPNLTAVNGFLLFKTIEIRLPKPAAGLVRQHLINTFGINLGFEDCLISVETADADIDLITAVSGQRTQVSFLNTTFGPNVPGKLFNGIAAGGNPNTAFSYETNVTSA